MGMVAGVFVLEDFVLAGWESQAELKHINRVDVQPCGTRQCAPLPALPDKSMCSRAERTHVPPVRINAPPRPRF